MKFKLKLSKSILKRAEEKAKLFRVSGNRVGINKVQALLLIHQGLLRSEVAKLVGISSETLRIWVRDFLQLGLSFLKRCKPSGRPSKLSKSQKRKLLNLIDKRPEASGFMGACWRTPMIQDLIKNEFGVYYSCQYIAQLLKNCSYSYQRATLVSAARDEEKRKMWLEKVWPSIMKEASKRNAYILFGDECSFAQGGSISYTWARRGVSPVIKTTGSKKAYKVFGFIEYFTGNFYSMGYEGKMNSDIYIEFIKDVLKRTRKHLFIIQDGAKYHTSDEVQDFFEENHDRITVYQLPVCSPDFNPIEKLWKKMKEKGTHLKYFPSFDSLVGKVTELLKFFSLHKEEIVPLFLKYDEMGILE